MRTMYDSVTPTNILKANRNPQMVAGYINGTYKWSDADWALFPNAVKVRISVRASFLDGHVLDVEEGDATPAEAPGWVRARRRAGFATPTIYCNRSTWPQVTAEFTKAGEPLPLWWAATGTGKAEIPAGAVAAQYLLDISPGIDVTAAADFWPGVDSQGEPDMDWLTPTPSPDWAGNGQTLFSMLNHIDQNLKELHRVVVEPGSVIAHDPSHTPTNLADLIADQAAWTIAQGNQLTAIQGAVTAEEANLLGAIKALSTGAVDANAVADALVPLLPKPVSANDLIAALGAKLAGGAQ